ncbi:hypothetical protein HDV05_003189 [Chytridiales sp. JEL 0842]|nr:hypothetical protein HDV05_003189 [Chytridiales sp. JEL 0842]
MSVAVGNGDFRPLATSSSAKITGVHESLLQECEKDIIWYRENFFGKAHQNYLAKESPRGPLAISVIQDGDIYKALIRSIHGSDRLTLPVSSAPYPFLRKLLGLGPSIPSLMNSILTMGVSVGGSASSSGGANGQGGVGGGVGGIVGSTGKSVRLCKEPNLPNELLAMEERQVIRSYKFGVAYVAPGQSTEEEMFANKHENASPAFKKFLNFLGETIELRGWKGYRAGLDVSGSNNTGTHSVYTKWQGYEVMFHVSTLLPFNEKDKQQLERKRHIGNDIVLIIFQESDIPFQLSTITSHQNHIVAVVRPNDENSYTLTCATKNGVPLFNPEIPDPPTFTRDAVSRDFFLHKLVNGERASYKSPSFAPKIQRTRSVLLYEVANKHLK